MSSLFSGGDLIPEWDLEKEIKIYETNHSCSLPLAAYLEHPLNLAAANGLNYKPLCSRINLKYLVRDENHSAIPKIARHLLFYGIYLANQSEEQPWQSPSFKVANGHFNLDDSNLEKIKLAQITDEYGDTAVMYAATQGPLASVTKLKWLLTHGARIFAKNIDGHNALEYVNRILSRTDVTGSERLAYLEAMHILCSTYLYRNQFFAQLPVPQEIAAHIKSYC